jgi:hypothetical protein
VGYAVRAYPCALPEAVAGARYRDWEFTLSQNPAGSVVLRAAGSPWDIRSGMTLATAAGWHVVLFPPQYLSLTLRVPDSGDPEKVIAVTHVFTVPPPEYAGDWDRWLLECVLAVHRHEAMEEFAVHGVREFYPAHGDEGDPYEVVRRSERKA